MTSNAANLRSENPSAPSPNVPNPIDTATFEGLAPEMVQRLYRELRHLAAAKLRCFPAGGHTLQPTALVHEAYIRLSRNPDKLWQGRRHFYRAAAVAMRHILIERARAKKARKRGGDWQRVDIAVTLADRDDQMILAPEDLMTLDRALTRLHAEYPELVEIAFMRYYCGLTVAEIANVIGMSVRTVERKWGFARAWLLTEMTGGHAS